MPDEQPRRFSLKFFTLLFLIALVRFFPVYITIGKWWVDSALNGNFAYQFTQGRAFLPFFAYQLPHYIHGSQVMNILLIPFYFLSGPYYGWISFIGLLISSAILAVSVSLIRREGGESWIWLAAFVFIFLFFPPPVYLYFMRTLWANHFETTLLLVLSISLYCWTLRMKHSFKYPLFVLGLFLGFSCYFCYTSIIFASAIVVSLLYLKGRKFLRYLWLFAVGFLVGFLPAILYNLFYENVILSTYLSQGAITASYSEAEQLRNTGLPALYDLFFKVMPRFLFCGAEHCKPNVQSIMFALLLGASLIYLGWQVVFKRDKNPLKVVILTTFIIFLLFYAVSSYAVFDYKNSFYYRYLIFLFPAMLIAIGFLLERLKILAPIVAILLLVGSHQIYRYPSSFNEIKYILTEQKGFDLVRIYEQSMPDYLSKKPLDAPRLAVEIANKTSGFEKVLALKGLGSLRVFLFRAQLSDIEQQVTSTIEKSDRKWLAFGWGASQAECSLRSKCEVPTPILESKEEEKWFSVGFILKYYWYAAEEDAYSKKAREELMAKLSTESLAFALGFSASDYIFSLPPWPEKPKNFHQLIYEQWTNLGGANDALVSENFWKGVGCETAFWFLVEHFIANERIYNMLITPHESLVAFKPDAESLLAGWHECLNEFGCKQIEEEWKIGKVIRVACEGEKF